MMQQDVTTPYLASSFFVKMAHVVSSDGSSVAEQLPVRLGQEYRVKLGRSFTFPEQNSFHTIKCEATFIYFFITVYKFLFTLKSRVPYRYAVNVQ